MQSQVPDSHPSSLAIMVTNTHATQAMPASVAPVVIPNVALGPTSTSVKGKKKSRELVDQGHVSKLVRDYWKHFNLFSKGRKKATLQLIPNKVWLDIYKDYLAQYPNSKLKEDSLNDHLHDSLKDMKSRVNNPEEVQGVVLQDDQLMEKLKNTDSWKARNVLKLRVYFMNGVDRSKSPPTEWTPPRALVAPLMFRQILTFPLCLLLPHHLLRKP